MLRPCGHRSHSQRARLVGWRVIRFFATPSFRWPWTAPPPPPCATWQGPIMKRFAAFGLAWLRGRRTRNRSSAGEVAKHALFGARGHRPTAECAARSQTRPGYRRPTSPHAWLCDLRRQAPEDSTQLQPRLPEIHAQARNMGVHENCHRALAWKAERWGRHAPVHTLWGAPASGVGDETGRVPEVPGHCGSPPTLGGSGHPRPLPAEPRSPPTTTRPRAECDTSSRLLHGGDISRRAPAAEHRGGGAGCASAPTGHRTLRDALGAMVPPRARDGVPGIPPSSEVPSEHAWRKTTNTINQHLQCGSK